MEYDDKQRAQRCAAVVRHDTEKIDKITVRCPKGTRERIAALGMSCNAFAVQAIAAELERAEKYGKMNK